LADRGRDVLILDRAHFPRAKACGECLNPGGVAALERLGLREAAERTAPIPLGGWSLVTPGRRLEGRVGERRISATGIRTPSGSAAPD
jgi:2-polyprenyl-6-methoxyphenol hydroxylase-like FAD-dependent oxidoreductase